MKIWAWGAVAALVIAALTAAAHKLDENGYTRAQLEYALIQREADLAWREQAEAQVRATDVLQVALLRAEAQVRTVETTVIKRVPIYVKENISCNLTRGAVRLYNIAWRGGGAAQDVPASTGITEEQAQQASTTTQRALITKDAQYARWCTALELRYDTLVTALDKLGY